MLTASEMAELDRRIAVMQAYRDGKPIQTRADGGEWYVRHYGPKWNWAVHDYRIAPEPRKPRELWAIFPFRSGYARIIAAPTKLVAMTDCLVEAGDEVVHMREVLPD
jgi:hypothetical protein